MVRPTLLLALALEGLSPALRAELLSLVEPSQTQSDEKRILRARHLYFEAGVFETAYKLVDKHQQKAEEIADQMENEELRRLMYYVVDTVLDRTAEVKPTIDIQHLSYNEVLPIVNGQGPANGADGQINAAKASGLPVIESPVAEPSK